MICYKQLHKHDLSLFKKSLQVIFISENNPEPPTALREKNKKKCISLKTVSFMVTFLKEITIHNTSFKFGSRLTLGHIILLYIIYILYTDVPRLTF